MTEYCVTPAKAGAPLFFKRGAGKEAGSPLSRG
jgi:hypothetical protein